MTPKFLYSSQKVQKLKQVLEGEEEGRELWGIPCVATGSTLITPSFILDWSINQLLQIKKPQGLG